MLAELCPWLLLFAHSSPEPTLLDSVFRRLLTNRGEEKLVASVAAGVGIACFREESAGFLRRDIARAVA
jgi:hypothetical protein